MPGHHTDSNDYIALMNVMYDMSQLVVVVPVSDESSATLASYFIQHVLLKFGLCHLVVLDDGTAIKRAFIAIYEALHLNRNVLANHNHKGLTIEHFHLLLNKSVTIATKEHGSNDIFVHAGVVAGYA